MSTVSSAIARYTAVILIGLFLSLPVVAFAAGPSVGPTGQYCWEDSNPAGTVQGYDLYQSQTAGNVAAATVLTVAPSASVCIPRDMTGKPNGQWYVGVAAHNAAGRSAFTEIPFTCAVCAIPATVNAVTVK